jgi:hypothetical protein
LVPLLRHGAFLADLSLCFFVPGRFCFRLGHEFSSLRLAVPATAFVADAASVFTQTMPLDLAAAI